METDDTEMQRQIRDRIRKLESVLSDIELERQARLEALSTNRATLRSQINRINETFRRLLHEDYTQAERIRTLFREQEITIALILTAIGMATSSTLGKTETWLAKNLSALAIAVGTLLLVAARGWLRSG